MTTFRVHFDGTVFIPDEPVVVPLNTPLRITVVADNSPDTPLSRLAALTDAVPQPDDVAQLGPVRQPAGIEHRLQEPGIGGIERGEAGHENCRIPRALTRLRAAS